MPTGVELRPVHDVVAVLAVAANCHVLGKYRHSGGCLAWLLAPGVGMHVLVVQAARRSCRAGQPVEHHVGEHEVAVDRILWSFGRMAPFLELLDDPGQLTNW